MLKKIWCKSFLEKSFSKKIVKEKAVFMIFLIIFSVFYFGLATTDVEAQRSSSRSSSVQQACCEKTKSGDSCVYTEKNECDRNFKSSLTTCDNTNYCSLGTCIYDKEGECFANTPKSSCEKNNGIWSNEPIEEISQCQKGCCQLSNECSFVTQNKCKSIVSQFPDLTMNFDKNIDNEAACVDKCRSGEKGACVSSDGSCLFTTRASCNEQGATDVASLNGTKADIKTGFHPNVLCSNALLGTNCARQQKTGCFEEKVFWYDSCGNPENVYDSNKDKSYNKGFLLKDSSCKLKGSEDLNCGDCDYSQGNLCGKFEDVKPTNGEFICRDLSCKKTTESIASPDSTGEKETGEGWCLYDARVGFGQDVVGSRHYRALCLNGEEVIEPCKDFREEICVQGSSDAITGLNLQPVFNIGEGYLESACRPNRYKECNSCNELGSSEKIQECCNDIGNKDCYFMPGGINNYGGMCVPLVPPGLKFWEGGSGKGSKGGTQEGADSVCEEASVTCEVKYVRGGTAKIGIGGLGTAKDWTCVKNCHCDSLEWVKAAASQCSARGDCGAKYNIMGKFTDKGFDTEFNGDDLNVWKLSEKDFGDWNTWQRQSSKKDDPTSLGNFWKYGWPALTLIAGIGLWAGIYSGAVAGSGAIIGGLGSGFLLGPKTLLSPVQGITTETVWREAFREGVNINNPGIKSAIKPPAQVAPDALGRVSGGTWESPSGPSLFDANGAVGIEGATYEGALVPKGSTQMIYTNYQGADQWVWANSNKEVLGKATDAQIEAMGNQIYPGEAYSFGWDLLHGLLEIVSVIAWIYTIYQLIDLLGKEKKTETVSVSCNAWQPPKGGDECQKCNEKGKECSEYRCRSLGKLCRLINEGTEEEKCVSQTPLDVNSPRITAIKPRDLQIDERKNEGFSIKTLIKPFTPVELSISTDEPSRCKFDTNTTIKYENMKFNFGDSLFRYNHTMLFSLPSELQNEEALRLTNGGKYSLYVRCTDANDNANNRDYYIKFEIDKGPDLTAPKIELTSIKNNGFVSENTIDAGLDIFVNEPSECRWDKNDQDFETMKNSFICVRNGLDQSPLRQGLYRCGTLLSDLKKGKNNFFFRCKDKPNEKDGRNVNKESYQFSLIRTEKLAISSIDPREKVFRTNPKISVKTVAGAENGVSLCGYSTERNAEVSLPQFSKTNSSDHEQQLRNLRKGRYTVYVTCFDRAGNIAKDSTTFEVAADTGQSVISYVYKDTRNNVLVIGTNEDSTCYYDNKVFISGEGIPMTDPSSKKHEAVLPVKSYFVLCKDAFNNEETITVYP